jgi:hypothetical protein
LRRVGVLISNEENDPQVQRQLAAFNLGLKELGWIEDPMYLTQISNRDAIDLLAFTISRSGTSRIRCLGYRAGYDPYRIK